ncbi:hypothetical protein CGCA056_v011040 [Colletotrichum aenigma]|uniref:uncharacterized protein n=1 Tax=Colletotrichum aenigma TaxID=1215731 RepID=UPI0018728627|nr:uncharacterized protein CGCA056_v011040 [Colletotrichum aenigma]KAF5517701.1 hypothetical protein CGCA056_v011040 [Colletotrichum aenigma]
MSRGPAYDAPAANSGQASPSPSLEERGRRRARAATTPIPASPSSSSSSAAVPVGPLSPTVNSRARVFASVRLRPSPARTPSYGSAASSPAAAATPLRATFDEAPASALAVRRAASPLPRASSPIAIPGAAERNRVHRRRTVGDTASGSGSGSDDDLFGSGFSAEELSAQATRLRERIGVGRGWVDPAGRLRALPHGARLPPPPSLTEEDLARARALSPAYPRGPSPPPPPPQTEEEYMRGVEERANEYHAF